MPRKKLMAFQLPSLFLIILVSSVAGVGNLHMWNWEDQQILNTMRSEAVFFEILDPPELEYTYKILPASGFGIPFDSSFLEKNIGLIPVEPATACQSLDNMNEVKGKVALITRGDCSFVEKTRVAEVAGAKAAIISDYYPATLEESRDVPLWEDNYVDMISTEEELQARPVNIPAGFLLGKNGLMIRKTLKRLNLPFAFINIPINLTYSSSGILQQPPWIPW